MLTERPRPSYVQMLLVTVLIIFIIAFAIISMNTGDILWFWPVFDGKPQSIIVHCYGEDVHVETWNSAYEPLNLAVNQSLSGSKR